MSGVASRAAIRPAAARISELLVGNGGSSIDLGRSAGFLARGMDSLIALIVEIFNEAKLKIGLSLSPLSRHVRGVFDQPAFPAVVALLDIVAD
jgi:hypothetical protein